MAATINVSLVYMSNVHVLGSGTLTADPIHYL
jgi:hypothetical protein